MYVANMACTSSAQAAIICAQSMSSCTVRLALEAFFVSSLEEGELATGLLPIAFGAVRFFSLSRHPSNSKTSPASASIFRFGDPGMDADVIPDARMATVDSPRFLRMRSSISMSGPNFILRIRNFLRSVSSEAEVRLAVAANKRLMARMTYDLMSTHTKRQRLSMCVMNSPAGI